MDQSDPCFYTKGDLTKPHLATRSSIFPMSVLSHLSHSIWEIIHLLKLIDYVLVQVDKPWYNPYPWGFTTFSNLSTLRENANNEESDQTGLWGMWDSDGSV